MQPASQEALSWGVSRQSKHGRHSRLPQIGGSNGDECDEDYESDDDAGECAMSDQDEVDEGSESDDGEVSNEDEGNDHGEDEMESKIMDGDLTMRSQEMLTNELDGVRSLAQMGPGGRQFFDL